MTTVESTLSGLFVVQFIGMLVNVAINRTRITGLTGRVRALEKAVVPRPEVEEKLKRIESLASHSNSLLMGLITSGADRTSLLRNLEAVAVPLSIPEAIAREEGFGKPGSRATRNNNPGNLDFSPWMAEEFAAKPEACEDPRFAAFPNATLGWAAMHHLLTSPLYAGRTVRAALLLWAPACENDVSAYEANVLAWTGLTPDTIIDGHLI